MSQPQSRRPKFISHLLGAWTIAVMAFLYLPIVLLVSWSFNSDSTGFKWGGFTLNWYAQIWHDGPLVSAVENSLLIAAATTVISVVIGTASAWLLHRFRFPARRTFSTLAYLPMIIPEIIMGVSLMLLFHAAGLGLGYATVIIAHVTFCFPFVMAAVQARLAGLDPSLEEAAMDLGATPAQAFFKVILPYLMPGVIAGALLAFTLSLDEFIVTFFTCSAESTTLPMLIYTTIKVGLKPTLNAVSTLFIAATVVLVIAANAIRRRGESRMINRLLVLGSALTLLLSGCGKRSERLHLFVVSEYVPREVIDGFSQESGIPVDVEVFDTNEAMLSKLIANPTGYDLIQPSEYTVEHLIGEKLLTPLDFSRIPNVKNLALDMRDLPYDPGQKYSVPYMSGTVGIVVNTDAVKEPIRGYADVFQEKYRQRIVVVDDNREIVSWAMSVHGIPINDVTPANLEKVTPTLKQWLALVKVFAPATPAPPLLGGEADIGVIYSGDAAALMAKDKRFTYVLPREGAHRFVDNLCIPAGAKHKEEAERFIDYVLRPQVSKIISDKFPYTNPNAEARKLLTREQLENPASYPPGGAQHLEVFHDIGPGAREISTLMTELRSR